jgi:hypothetical protein
VQQASTAAPTAATGIHWGAAADVAERCVSLTLFRRPTVGGGANGAGGDDDDGDAGGTGGAQAAHAAQTAHAHQLEATQATKAAVRAVDVAKSRMPMLPLVITPTRCVRWTSRTWRG